MRYLYAILSLLITIGLVYLLNTPMGGVPAFGKLLDPVNGFWANAEPVDKDFNTQLNFPDLDPSSEVWFDDRLVPHINAANDHDLYFLQGYVHAYFRLWQMDMQTRAAAGRVSEVVGEKTVAYDREQRRKGMVYGAERSLKMMEEDSRTRGALDAYSEGVNAHINSLNSRTYPLEYKLMGFKPEQWSNINTALLLMYMADDLTGGVEDIQYSKLLEVLSKEEVDFYFPDRNIGSTPVIPTGTKHDWQAEYIAVEYPGDRGKKFPEYRPPLRKDDNSGKGSNNWVLSSKKTKNGYPILCDDPHLNLNLPSIWYEVQLNAPSVNVYGVSLPGAPGVVIGYNEHISWGFTNNYRDVKDYYTIDVVDDNSYRFNGNEVAFDKRVEVIKVKGMEDVIDTVKYTLHGPVIYDEHFRKEGVKETLAMKWMAHKPSNELLSLYLLNRAADYPDYVKAISYFTCPAQNFVFADTKGNIAIWGQGQFIDKWKGQGKYIMDGSDSSTLWGHEIPIKENPRSLNPDQGYLASANQTVTDSTYPYWYNGDFGEYRAWRINKILDTLNEATVEDMFAMQSDVYDMLAEGVLPIMLKNIKEEGEYISLLKGWNYRYDIDDKAPTVFRVWWHYFYNVLWQQTKFGKLRGAMYPLPERTMQLLQVGDSCLGDVAGALQASYLLATDSLNKLKETTGFEWYKVKNTTVRHLARIPAFSYSGLKTGGWGTTINAMKGNHGPSWRMVVEMKDKPVGYGIYPGGQSGNPGSKYYGAYIDKWVNGKYNELVFVTDSKTDAIKYVWKTKGAE
ncbi:MAG: penicillin acylase family protein [Chitinophagales bacterium]|nr:penicillin acylase family protein [Chitinophagaceae bacterium]MCB9064424.1 penicillin acylase family protein [Chitinophagales bacterium]